MDTSCRSLFLQSCVILLLHVMVSLSEDFDVTTIYNFQKTLDTGPEINYMPASTFNKTCSIEIHARNNARGLPFLTQAGSTVGPNFAVDIETCSFFDNDCNWTQSNFSNFFIKSPLNLQGKTGVTATKTIEDGEVSQLQLFHNELSFTGTFYSSNSYTNGELRIYLMDSLKGLNEANLYYFIISMKERNDLYRYYGDLSNTYNYFYRCTNEYKLEPHIVIASGYENRRCKVISETQNFYNRNHRELDFLVKTEQSKVSLIVTSRSNEDENYIFSWTDDDPLNIEYYAVGSTSLKGSFTPKIDPDEQLALILTHENGSIVSEAFVPSYSDVCVSVVYYKGPQGSIALQIVNNDGEKLYLKQLQTTSLSDGWVSSIYSAQIPQEKSNSSIRIELTAETAVGTRSNIAIQQIGGCSSEGLEEDIYVVSSNKTVTEIDLYAYDVAVKRSPTDSKEKLECLHGGLFDSERNSCICPAGFVGNTCEVGCGPDRYDSKCSGRCSKTEKGCMEMKLCRPKLGCNCAPGLKGVLCDTTCSSGEYGANCKQKCGNCIYESCDIYTGHCPSGCQEGFYPPFCQTRYKYLITLPKVISPDYHTLHVEFSIKPEELAGSGTPTFYQIQIRDEENKLNTWTELEPILLPTTQSVETNITLLKPGTNYEVRVVLLDLDGNSYQGEDVPVVNGFTNCIVPNVDYNLNTIIVVQKEFQIKWEYSVESDLWCKLKHFEVDMNADWKWKPYYEGTEKFFTFTDLLPGEKYKVRVRGISVNGPLPFSEPLIVMTQDEAPRSVYAPRIVSRAHNQIEINWKEPFSPRGKIQKYKVTYKCKKLLACNDDCSYFAGDVEVRTPSVTLQGLRPHTQYLISIAAKSALYGPDVQILATTDMGEPEVSPSLSASTIAVRTNSTLTVQWKRPENCTYLNGYLYGYQYEFFEPKNPSPLHEGSTFNTSTTFFGLNPHTDYEVKVYLVTSGGRSSSHPLVINASTRATVPGKVEQLTIYKVGRRLIGLRWALPKETYGDIRSFTISYKSEHQQDTSFMVKPTPCIAWPDLYCHTINSLRADTEYTVKIQARNKEVNEDGEIAQIVVTTKESAPLAPDYIKTASQTETSLTIEWGLPKLINGVLRSFLVNIEETDSVNITDCCQYFPIQEVAVRNEQASYRLQLNNLKPASTYAISVTAKTMALGPAVSITAHTRPPVPSMDGMFQPVDDGDSSELLISSTPTFNINSTTINRDLLVGYLIVVIPQSANVSVQETTITNEWLAQELKRQINTTFYIAAELNQNDWENDAAQVVLGKESDLKTGKWSLLWDPVLENKQQYCIGLVTILDYCGILNVGFTATDILTVSNEK